MSHLFLTLPCGFKAAQCSSQPIPSGRRVPIFRSGVGCGFRLWPRWETASRFDRKFRVAFSAQALNRKPCPVSQPNTGMHFPLSPSTGKCIPFHSQIPGWTFRNSAHPESPSHPEHIRVRFSATCYAQALQCGARPAASCCMNPIEWCEKKPGYVW